MRHFMLGVVVGLLLTAAVSFAQSNWDYDSLYGDSQIQQQLDQIQRQQQQHESDQWFRDEQLKLNSQWPC